METYNRSALVVNTIGSGITSQNRLFAFSAEIDESAQFTGRYTLLHSIWSCSDDNVRREVAYPRPTVYSAPGGLLVLGKGGGGFNHRR